MLPGMTSRAALSRFILASSLMLGVAAAACRQESPAARAGAAPDAPAWRSIPSPETPSDRPLRAGFLIVNGVYNSELMAPYDILHHSPLHTKPEPGIEVFTVSPDGRPVVTFEGLTIVPHHGFETAPGIDILVVPSAEGSMTTDLENEEMVRWVGDTGRKARFVISLCDGAFVLAAAGLLDGHTCTTFPGDQDQFQEMFPDLDLVRGPSFVHDGKLLTSQGGARSYDVAMYLIDHLYGEEVARNVGRGLIIDWPPTAESMSALVVPHASPPPQPSPRPLR